LCTELQVHEHTDASTLHLHDALPISQIQARLTFYGPSSGRGATSVSVPVSMPRSRFRPWTSSRSEAISTLRSCTSARVGTCSTRSEEDTSELQSRGHLVCRLPLAIKK